MVQARKVTFRLARPVAVTTTSPIQEQMCVVPLAKGRAQSEQRWCVSFVKEVAACCSCALTVDVIGWRGVFEVWLLGSLEEVKDG